jgi:hypothetical protein
MLHLLLEFFLRVLVLFADISFNKIDIVSFFSSTFPPSRHTVP